MGYLTAISLDALAERLAKLENSTEKYEKGKQYESFKVLAEAWDDTMSRQAIDSNIVRHLASIFDALPARKGKKSVL